MMIPIAKPFIGEEEAEAASQVIKSGWLVQGPKVFEFERMLSEYTASAHACAASNCTTALQMALLALDIQNGDEVVLPAFTYVASANAIEAVGARPIFADIDLNTFNIDIGSLEPIVEYRKRKAGGRLKCIMPVHLFGLCADMDTIVDLAKCHKLSIVEDAACAIGSRIGNRHAGTFGDVGCYSFHPRKLITTGEGGVMLTADSGLDEKMRSLRDHGAAVSDYARHKGHGSLLPEFNMVGYNYRMTDIQASIGIEQMKKIKHIVDRRRAIAAGYDQAFRDFPSICIPAVPGKYVHTYQSYVILLKPHVNGGGIHAMIDDVRKRRNNIMAQLAEKGITTRQGTSAVHLLGFYRNKYGYKINDYPNSAMADYASISLPIYTEMSEVEQQYVIDCVRESVSNSQ